MSREALWKCFHENYASVINDVRMILYIYNRNERGTYSKLVNIWKQL